MFIKNDPEYNTDHNAGWTIGGFTQRWFWLLSPHGRSSGLLLSEMELGKYIGDTEIWIYYIYIQLQCFMVLDHSSFGIP